MRGLEREMEGKMYRGIRAEDRQDYREKERDMSEKQRGPEGGRGIFKLKNRENQREEKIRDRKRLNGSSRT